MGGSSKLFKNSAQAVDGAAKISAGAIAETRRISGDAKAQAGPRLSPRLYRPRPWGLK